MSTDHQRLKTTLDELHRQLADLEQLDPALRDQLSAALGDIQSALQAKSTGGAAAVGGSGEAGGEWPIDRLRDAARSFEESHPALSGTIGSLIDTLARMGI